MHPYPDLNKIFSKFAGKEIRMCEEEQSYVDASGNTHKRTQIHPADPHDPILKEMEDVASANWLKLRVWWPGVEGSDEFDPNRVNAQIEKGRDGKWRVGKHFAWH